MGFIVDFRENRCIGSQLMLAVHIAGGTDCHSLMHSRSDLHDLPEFQQPAQAESRRWCFLNEALLKPYSSR